MNTPDSAPHDALDPYSDTGKQLLNAMREVKNRMLEALARHDYRSARILHDFLVEGYDQLGMELFWYSGTRKPWWLRYDVHNPIIRWLGRLGVFGG